jgi:hypothetical protein
MTIPFTGSAPGGTLFEAFTTRPADLQDASLLIEYGHGRAAADEAWSELPEDDPNRFAFVITRTSVGWLDDLTIEAPGQSGFGWLAVELRIGSGELVVTGATAESDYVVTLSLASGISGPDLLQQQWAGSCYGSQSLGECSGPEIVGDPFGRYESDLVRFTWGQPIDLGVRLDADAVGRLLAAGESRAVVTLDWLGFAQVLDANLQPVANYAVTSDSGVDWSQPVPEPPSAASALAALLCATVLSRLAWYRGERWRSCVSRTWACASRISNARCASGATGSASRSARPSRWRVRRRRGS